MKLPSSIKTRRKIRDFKICALFARENLTMEEIAQRFGMTHQNVSVILSKNKEILKLDIEFEKAKRVNRLYRLLPNAAPLKKDEVEIYEQIRKELEGEKSAVETHNHFVVYRNPQAEKESLRQEIKDAH